MMTVKDQSCPLCILLNSEKVAFYQNKNIIIIIQTQFTLNLNTTNKFLYKKNSKSKSEFIKLNINLLNLIIAVFNWLKLVK